MYYFINGLEEILFEINRHLMDRMDKKRNLQKLKLVYYVAKKTARLCEDVLQ